MDSYKSGYIQVDFLHKLYYACYGNKNGKPIMLFHGGPGYGITSDMLEPFDPTLWNIIAIDQRGCGKSLPIGCLERNSTEFLVDDMRLVADFLSLDKFAIKAESWGTTLALLFAEKYPEYVSSMILTGVFLGDNEGTLLGKFGGFEMFYPEYWNEYVRLLPVEKRNNPYMSYYDYILNGTDEEKQKFGRELIFLENLFSYPVLDEVYANQECDNMDCYNIARIETHYTVNDFFIKKGQIVDHIGRISNIPISIVQGRFDLVVPIKSAWQLSQLHPKCELIISEFGGHADDSEENSRLLKTVINSHLSY